MKLPLVLEGRNLVPFLSCPDPLLFALLADERLDDLLEERLDDLLGELLVDFFLVRGDRFGDRLLDFLLFDRLPVRPVDPLGGLCGDLDLLRDLADRPVDPLAVLAGDRDL